MPRHQSGLITSSTDMTFRKWQLSLGRFLGIVTCSAVAARILAFQLSGPLPQERLLEKAAEASGYKSDELHIRGGGYGGNWIHKWAYLELQTNTRQPKTLYIEMERCLPNHKWQVSEYRGDE